MLTTTRAIPVKRDILRMTTEFAKVLYLCMQFFLSHPLLAYTTIHLHFPITSLGPIRAFDVHEICIFGDLLQR